MLLSVASHPKARGRETHPFGWNEMAEVGTRTYRLEYPKVAKEVMATMLEHDLQLKKTDIQGGHLIAIWRGRYRDPDERVDVRLWTSPWGIQVMAWAKPTSPLAKRIDGSGSIPVLFHGLDERIGKFAVDMNAPEGYPPYYPGPDAQLWSYRLSPSIWWAVALALTNGLIPLFFGTMGMFFDAIPLIALCNIIMGTMMLIAATLLALGKLTAGGWMALVCGILMFPIGLLGIVAGLWAFKVRDNRVPLIPDHSYALGHI